MSGATFIFRWSCFLKYLIFVHLKISNLFLSCTFEFPFLTLYTLIKKDLSSSFLQHIDYPYKNTKIISFQMKLFPFVCWLLLLLSLPASSHQMGHFALCISDQRGTAPRKSQILSFLLSVPTLTYNISRPKEDRSLNPKFFLWVDFSWPLQRLRSHFATFHKQIFCLR